MKRIKGYKDFLNYLIFESIIESTYEFKMFLYNLRDKNSPVSDKANQIINKLDDADVKTNINYLGMSPNSNNEISFIPDSQYQRYISNNDEARSKSKNYSNVGRAFRQLLISFEIPFNDKDIENLTNEYKSYWDSIYSNKKFEIVKGAEILKWYLESNYTEQKSSLGNSCMRFTDRNHYMKLYAENPDTISMCVVKEGDKISARALVWTLDDGKTYLDRIYYTEDSLVSFMYDNMVKLHSKDLYSYDYTRYPNDMVVNIKEVDYEKYPYADVMCYVYQKIVDGKIEGTGKVSNKAHLKLEGEWRIIKIQSTSGDPDDLTHYKSEHLDIYIPKEEAVYIRKINDYVRKSDLNYSNYLQTYLTKEDSVYSEDINDFIPKEEAIQHPKFGLVPKDRIFKIFDEYSGKEEPIEIFNKLKNEDYSGFNLKEELLLKMNKDFKFFNIIFESSDTIDDIGGETVPKIFCEKVFRISNDVRNQLKKDGLECLLIYDYILEIDAISLGVEHGNARYAHSNDIVSRLMQNYGEKPYLNYISGIENEKIKKERELKFKAYDNYLKSNDTWNINSNFEKEEIMDLYIEVANNALEFGDSEKLFVFQGREGLNFYELFGHGITDIYGRDALSAIDSENIKLLFSLYKKFLFLYYITMDSYDVRRYFSGNLDKKELLILQSIRLSGDDLLEVAREITKTTHRDLFLLIPQAFGILKDLDESIIDISLNSIRSYLKSEFYDNHNFTLFKQLDNII
jgi:hypothetical protein